MGVSFVRTIIIFLSLVVSLRIMGKRQLGELEPLELVVAILISNLASQPLADVGTPLVYGLVPIFTLLACQLLISRLTVKSIRFRRLICGTPSILIERGKLVEREMRRNRISVDELMAELRRSQVTDPSKVRRAILETDGSLSVTMFTAEAPVTPAQMGVTVQDPGCPITVICDGRLMSENLRLTGRDERWLKKELSRRGIASVSDVYLLNVDDLGEIYITPKEA